MTPPVQRVYDVLGEIGRGGMATVSVARFRSGDRLHLPVVLKRMLPELHHSREHHESFLEEATTLSYIDHPNVVRVLEVGREQNGFPFIVAEYLHGEPLSRLLARAREKNERLPFDLSAFICAEVCAGLHAAHETRGPQGELLNVVHRDISPHNIFIGFDGRVRVIDFGIARTDVQEIKTREGILKGKIPYMSPEQCLQQRVDRASDIFSTGAVLFQLLTGRRPYEAESDFHVMQKILESVAPDPRDLDSSVPATLADICLQAMEREPSARYATANEMRRALLRSGMVGADDREPADRLAQYVRETLPEEWARKEKLLAAIRSGEGVSVGVPVAAEEGKAFVTATIAAAPGFVDIGSGSQAMGHAAASRGPGWKPFVVAALLAAVALTAFWAIRPAAMAPRAKAPRATPAPVVSQPAQPRAPVVADAEVTLQISTVPEGVVVYLGDSVLGESPFVRKLARTEGGSALRFEKSGYASVTQRVDLRRDASVHVALSPLAAERPRASRARQRRSSSRGAPSSAPKPGEPTWPVFE